MENSREIRSFSRFSYVVYSVVEMRRIRITNCTKDLVLQLHVATAGIGMLNQDLVTRYRAARLQ